MPFRRWGHECGCSNFGGDASWRWMPPSGDAHCFTFLIWTMFSSSDLDWYLIGFDCSQTGFPFRCLRHPLWAGLFRVCNVTHATVVSLRGSVGILDSICSAMSYVAGFTTCIYAWIEYLAYSFCIAGVTGIGGPCYLWLLLCSWCLGYICWLCVWRTGLCPNPDHPVLWGLMTSSFCTVCTADAFGLIMSVDVVVHVQQRCDGKVVLTPIETTNKSAWFRPLVFDEVLPLLNYI
jgi:hypothetical protein